MYVEREPVGEWICLESQTRIAAGGIGVTESVLYDERGRVGRATQALFVARRRLMRLRKPVYAKRFCSVAVRAEADRTVAEVRQQAAREQDLALVL